MTAVFQWILSSGSGCISSDRTSHHGHLHDNCPPAVVVVSTVMPQRFHAFCMKVSSADSLFSGTLLLMPFRRAAVSHCPIGICERHVVAQTRTDVFLASLMNNAGVGSSRYDIYIMETDGSVLYNRRTRRSVYSAIKTVIGMSGKATRPHHQMPYRIAP